MSSISFFAEEVVNPISNFPFYNDAISKISFLEGYTINQLSYIFCSDSFLLNINQKFLDHDYLTDVITFDYSDTSFTIIGDIFISTDRVADNALLLSHNFFDELHRVMIHGLLHLMGYDDSNIYLTNIIRSKENFYLPFFVTVS
jgi:probable rRNA maturation factor